MFLWSGQETGQISHKEAKRTGNLHEADSLFFSAQYLPETAEYASYTDEKRFVKDAEIHAL